MIFERIVLWFIGSKETNLNETKKPFSKEPDNWQEKVVQSKQEYFKASDNWRLIDSPHNPPESMNQDFGEIKGKSKEEVERYFEGSRLSFRSCYEDEFNLGMIFDTLDHILIFSREDKLIEIYRPDREL